MLIKVKDDDGKVKIPGGTPGYLTPEYFLVDKLPPSEARKEDYFALGSSIFYIKYGESLIKYTKYEKPLLTSERINDILHIKTRTKIYSNQLLDQNLIDLLSNLLQYKPNDRSSFEEIYRNKWLNTNKDIIDEICFINEGDEEKMIIELQKSDFLIEKKKEKEQKNIQKQKKFRFKKKGKN